MSADFLVHIPVAQGAAGTTQLAAATSGKRHKVVGAVLLLDAAGTLKFTDSGGDLTGAMDIGATGGFVLPTTDLPYTQALSGSALSLVTTVGKAKGVVTIVTEP